MPKPTTKPTTTKQTRTQTQTPTPTLKAQLPEIDDSRVQSKLDRASTLKFEIGDARKGTGLAGELSGLLGELEEYQVARGLEGLRHGRVVFQSVEVKGRVTTDLKKFQAGLLERGVDVEVIRAAMEDATKEGDMTTRKSLEVLG